MGAIANRVSVVARCITHRLCHGLPECEGRLDREVLFILDGVGGFQFAPVMVRRALDGTRSSIGTIWYRWQWGLVGEIWTDLMWFRRNRVMGAQLARKILALRRQHPEAVIHMLAVSGGAGIGVFACESLAGGQKAATGRSERATLGAARSVPPALSRTDEQAPAHDGSPVRDAPPILDTLILACPAMSPGYNLAPALTVVRRATAWVSSRDRYLLGAGTTLFGTTDRKFGSAAGRVGFHVPDDASTADRGQYARLTHLHWTPELRRDGHYGGHTGWMNEAFLRRWLIPTLRGETPVASAAI